MGAGGMNPMMMFSMMSGMRSPMGMPGMGMPGMPMGMMGPMGGMPPGMAPPVLEDGDAEQKGGSRRRRRRAKDGDGESGSPGQRRRSRSRRRPSPRRIQEVEEFMVENRINEEAAVKIRSLSPESQKKVIARPLTGDVQNPSKVMIARVRELQSQAERAKTPDMWSAWGGAMMGATPESINKYIEENDLDESAVRQMRALPPHQQAAAIRFDLSGFRNPSAKFMSMANNLAIAPSRPHMAMMPGMPPMMPGMPPMMGMPHMMGMPGMGMPPMGMPGYPPPPSRPRSPSPDL